MVLPTMPYVGVLLVMVCTVFATVKAEETCTDRFASLCARHKRDGHCENPRWARMLKNICQKTCNFCQVNAGEMCTDRFASLCARHKRDGHCENPLWARMLKNICQKTCNFCQASGKKVCVDDNEALCEGRQRRGQCDQPTYYTLTFCKKTCDFCSGHIKRKVVPKPPPCTDGLNDCKRIAAMGLCDKLGKVKLSCKLSCNLCDGTVKTA